MIAVSQSILESLAPIVRPAGALGGGALSPELGRGGISISLAASMSWRAANGPRSPARRVSEPQAPLRFAPISHCNEGHE